MSRAFLFSSLEVICILYHVNSKKGLTGKRIEYFSVPWEKIVAFGVCSAGFMIDFDTEVKLYTEMGFWPGQRKHVELTVLVSYRLELRIFFFLLTSAFSFPCNG